MFTNVEVSNIIYMLIGAGLAIVGGLVEGYIARRWRIDETKQQKRAEAKEHRLLQAEEFVRGLGDIFLETQSTLIPLIYYVHEDSLDVKISRLDMMKKHSKNVIKLWEKSTSFGINAPAISSLQDDGLNTAVKDVMKAFSDNEKFHEHVVKLSYEIYEGKVGEEEIERLRNEAKRLAGNFEASSIGFLKRVNELRSEYD